MLILAFNVFIYLVGVFRRTQQYFTHKTGPGVMVRRNQEVPGRNPQLSKHSNKHI